MTSPAFDAAILGAGPVGCALALLLARRAPDPARIAVLRAPRRADVQTGRSAAADPRVLALNHGSRQLLESLGAWDGPSAAILDIHVSQRGRLGRTLISHRDFDVPRLGDVIAYADLHRTLSAALEASGVTVLETAGARIAGQTAARVRIDGGAGQWDCAVALQADGLPAEAGPRRDYRQHAVLTLARAGLPRAGWAWERFTRDGPLALLPHPHAPDAYAVVWCCRPPQAAALAALDDAAFGEALTQAFGTRLGRLAALAPRHAVPLAQQVRPTLADGRAAALGNAAQTLHPVAGQGLNLGLRDATQLAQRLGPWLCRPADDPRPLLQDFARARRLDRGLTIRLTDFMPRIFSTGLAPVEHACGLALLGLDLVPALRRPVAHHLLYGQR